MRTDAYKRIKSYLEEHSDCMDFYTASFVITCEDMTSLRLGDVIEVLLFGNLGVEPMTVGSDGIISEWVRVKKKDEAHKFAVVGWSLSELKVEKIEGYNTHDAALDAAEMMHFEHHSLLVQVLRVEPEYWDDDCNDLDAVSALIWENGRFAVEDTLERFQ